MKKWYIIFGVILVAGLIAYAFLTVLEFTPPAGEWQNRAEYLNKTPVITIAASDEGQGLRTVEVTFKRGTEAIKLHSEDLSGAEPAQKEATLDVTPDFKTLGLEDGEGTITVSITDRSLWNLGKGNTLTLEYPVVIDTVPPLVGLLSVDHVVVKGGSEVTVYRASTDVVQTGVAVGGYFFPGHTGAFEDENTYVAFFSYPYDLGSVEPIFITAEDRAGNMVKKSLPVLVKPKRYLKRTLVISDEFIMMKVPEVLTFANMEETGDLLTDFLTVNKELRNWQASQIREITRDTRSEFLWKGGFKQFRNTSVEARFADFRIYKYKGEVVDQQYHLGYDLAATKRFPIGASNSGVVVFAGSFGIYGNTVVIDHGFGLFTLYSHMSTIDVAVGDSVERGAIIGRTGETGLAGGDHLHFGVYLHGTPVTPIEWWDAKWVRNRILRRLRVMGE
jgi:hypothetical protein